jgi:hypothetical protein
MPDVISVEFSLGGDGKQCEDIECTADAKFLLVETETYAPEGEERTQQRRPVYVCFAHALETLVAFRDGEL